MNRSIAVFYGVMVLVLASCTSSVGQAAAPGRGPVTRAGEGIVTTDRFRLSGDYLVIWTATDTGSKAVGCYHGLSVRPDHSLLVSASVPGGKTEAGTTWLYGAKDGMYHMDVSSGCRWTVTLSPQ